ncbi:MAG: DNA gyrase subunit A [Minisyncoccales bacterium]|jgi:DNA gyrase subunit A
MSKSEKSGSKGAEIGYVKSREITEEMQESYIDYAMSVIISRALPDVRDGLKPVQRRILYTMYEDGLKHSVKFRKSANVIGSVLGRYHPHGDMSVYDAMARMTQDFSFRYTLVDGQGNFGSIDGDSPAAYRYTEARLSRVGEEMLKNIEKDTVDFVDNYDGVHKEPSVLPSPLPHLLINGTLGIAVGMATSIPPHNLSEVIDAAIYIIKNPKATTEDLFEFIKGPDFPTGGQIYNREEIITAYSQGRGPIVVRGKVDVVEKGRNQQIVITEIPYQVNKATMIEQFAKLVTDKKIDGVKDIRDESDREGLRITLDLKADAHPKKIINRLYKFSNLQKTFHLNMIALVDGIQPRTLSLSEALSYYVDHRKDVTYRKTKFELEKAKERAHILEGLVVALTNIDKCIKIIRESKSKEDAKKNLMKSFKLTEIQANAILEIRLHQLARMERERIEDELKAKLKEIKELTAILKSPKKVESIVEKELIQAKEAFGDERKTKVHIQKLDEISEEDLIPLETTIITITNGGYIKRINPQTYKIQKRGGKGILGMKTTQDDLVEHFIEAKTHDSLLFFTDSGKVFRIPAYEIPEATRVARGRGIFNFLEISSQEKVLSVIPLSKEDEEEDIKYLVMGTEKGVVKKTLLKDFKNIRRSGLIAIKLRKGDLLKNVCKTAGDDDIIMVTEAGQSIRFKEKDVRGMGRTASGIRGIKLRKGDKVVGMDVVKNENGKEDFLLVVTENGFGKKTLLKEYRVQQRGGVGVKALNITQKTGSLVVSKTLTKEEEELIVISRKGNVIKSEIDLIPKLSRATQGVRIMRLAPQDKVASAICI